MSCIDHGKLGDKDGYAHCSYLGQQTSMHRRTFMQAHHLSHTDVVGKVVRHSCDNPRCINVGHLELGSHSDNMEDMRVRGRAAHGEAHAKTVLTLNDVRAIRASEEKQRVLAEHYGVSQGTISNIKRNVTWRI